MKPIELPRLETASPVAARVLGLEGPSAKNAHATPITSHSATDTVKRSRRAPPTRGADRESPRGRRRFVDRFALSASWSSGT
jgi:hypothetical protein